MKLYILILTLIMCCTNLLFGAIEWNNPVDLFNPSNIGFTGTALHTSDNFTLVMWDEGFDSDLTYLQKYNSQIQPVWAIPLLCPSYSENTRLMETSNGNILLYWWSGSSVYANLMNSDGEYLWQNLALGSLYSIDDTNSLCAKPDSSGGAYVIQCYDKVELRLFHIRENGTIYPGSGQIALSWGWGFIYNPNFVVLDDNSVIVSYCLENIVHVRKFDSNMSEIWELQYPQTAQYVFPYLCKSDLSSYYLLLLQTNANNRETITVSKYTNSGVPLWDNTVTITTLATSSPALMSTTNGNITVIWTQDYHSLMAQMIDTNGQLLMGSSGTQIASITNSANYELLADNMGGGYAYWNTMSGYNLNQITAQHITATGDVLPLAIDIRDQYIDQINNGHYLYKDVNNMGMIYADIRDPHRGIYAQSVTPQGTNLYDNDGLTLLQNSGGSIGSAKLSERTDGTLVIWKQSPYYIMGFHDFSLKYQFVNPNGSYALDPDNVLLTTNSVSTSDSIRVATSPDNYSMIVWNEGNLLKAQLFDPELHPLWEINGRQIAQALYGSQFDLNYDNGSFYVVWVSAGNIFGQRFSNGVSQWTLPGIQLVSGIDNIFSLNGRFITWKANSTLYAFKFNEDGSIANGFDLSGNQVATISPNSYGIELSSSYLYQDDLLITYYNYYEDYTVQWGVKIMNSEGSLGWSGASTQYRPFLTLNDNIYTSWIEGSTLHFQRIYSESSATWETSISLAELAYRVVLSIYLLPENRYLFIIKGINGGLYHLYYYDSDSAFHIPSTGYEVVLPHAHETEYSYLSSNNLNGTAVLWGGYDSLSLQLLGNTYVPNDDETSTPFARLSLHNAYPNPFSKKTNIAFDLPSPGIVKLEIYNVKGQKVKSLLNEQRFQGMNEVTWNGKDDYEKSIASGVYFAKIHSGGQSVTKKLVLVK